MEKNPSNQTNPSTLIDPNGQHNNKEIHRTRRVGSITCGLMLVLYGILFMVHIIQPRLNYTVIFELWPLILVFLGVEILASSTPKSQEKKKYVYDFAAVLLIFIVAFFAMIMSAVSYYYDYYDKAYGSDAGSAGQAQPVSGEEVFAAKDVNAVSLNNAFWDIKVQPSKDNDIHVSYNGTSRNANVVRLNQVQNNLMIDIDETQSVKAFFWWGRGYERIAGELTLFLPETYAKSLKLNNTSGDMQIQGISCGELVLNNEYGDMKLENVACAESFLYENEAGNMLIQGVSCGDFALNNEYGDTKIDNFVCSASFSYENGSGDVQFKNVSCEGLKLNNEYGNVKLDNIACTSFEFDNDSGNMKIENSSCGDFNMKNVSGTLEIDNTSFEDFSINSDIGNVSLKRSSAKDTAIMTDSGNIEMTDSSIEAGKVATESGSIAFNGVLAKSMDINSIYGDVNMRNADRQTETSISGESGNISIRYKDKPADNSFEIKSEYGNISIRLEDTEYDYNLESEKRGKIGNGTYHTQIVTESGNVMLE